MRLVTFTTDADRRRAGALVGSDAILPLAVAARLAGLSPREQSAAETVRGFLELEATARTAIADVVADGPPEETVPLESVDLGPPVPDAQKIICIGLNYRDHAEEAGLALPSNLIVFAKFANSLVGPADEIVVPPDCGQIDYEAELGVVIGSTTRNTSVEDALDRVAGVMAVNDVSARDLQMATSQWTMGKAIDTFAPCGPALVTLDEIASIQDLAVETRVNGETMQSGTTADMVFPVAEIIARLSRVMTLVPGDVIATGTPAGVGMGRTPPIYLNAGDEVEVEISGVGLLRNRVVGETN